MLLEINNLRVHYGKAEALKGVSLAVEEGSIVALIGANGAGKTTILKTISGLKQALLWRHILQGKENRLFVRSCYRKARDLPHP